MSEKRLFYYGLMGSLLVHLLFITFLSTSKIKMLRKQVKQIEVVYQQIKPHQKKQKKKPLKTIKAIKQDPVSQDAKLFKEKKKPFYGIDREIKDLSKMMSSLKTDKKFSPKMPSLSKDRKITIPLLKTEKISNPKYLSYNEGIRQRIKQRAYSYVNHPDFREGEVYLTFVLDSRGSLKIIKVIEARTRANNYLKNIGLRSIKEAGPFPAFPKDLPYPELTFNVIISFEVKENE